MMDRVILHCDCNSFFASVETISHPEYASVPMAVAGSEEARRGIILAKNQLAGKYGVKTAETIREAKRKCPNLLLVPPHHSEYARISAVVRRIYERYTDKVEPFGMDECWLDVTASQLLYGNGEAIANHIRETVKREVGITVSVGVSFNKIFAKLGSDYKKPDAVTVILREDVERIVYPLPVESMLFVGRRTADSLRNIGIRTIGDLAAAGEAFLKARFGKMGQQLSVYARGEDQSPVADAAAVSDPKSVGSGMTFRRDLVTLDDVRLGVMTLAEDVAARLRKSGMVAGTVAVHIKDPMLHSISRQKPQSPPSNLAREISKTALEIVESAWRIGAPIRMLTVTGSNLLHAGDVVEQIGFFDGDAEGARKKTEKLEETVDRLRAKFGSGAVKSGAVLGNELGIGEGSIRHDQRKAEDE